MATGTQARLKPAPASSTRSRTAMKSRTAAKAVPTTAAASQQPSHHGSKTRPGLKPPPVTAARPKVTMKVKTVSKTARDSAASAKQTSHQESWQTEATEMRSRFSVNAEALVWARDRYGLSQEEAARKMRIKVERLTDWESGNKKPTNIQLRKLAEIYERHPWDLMGPFIPPVKDVELAPDYRFCLNAPNEGDLKRLSRVQEWAERIRSYAISMLEDLDEEVPLLPSSLRFSTDSDPETVAEIVRDMTSFPIEGQHDFPSSAKFEFIDVLRQNVEDLGIMVLKDSELIKVGARGLCLFQKPLPVIVFSNESPGAQAFSVAHMLGHVLLGNSGIIGESTAIAHGKNRCHQTEEVWCNRFATAFLVPASALLDVCKRPDRPKADFDQKMLSKLSRKFSVSNLAMAIRLVSLGYITEDFYWDKLRPKFTEMEKERRRSESTRHTRKRYVSRVGRFYTSLIIDSWHAKLISLHNACDYMGIKKIQHFVDIMDNEALRI